MAHFMIENPFISNTTQYGRGLDSPRPARFMLANKERSPKFLRKQHSDGDSMWVNFQKNEKQSGPVHTSNSKNVGPPPPPAHDRLVRQSSSQSSFRSNKSTKSTTSLLKKKVQEHAFKTNTVEWQREQEYQAIRQRRKKLRQQMDSKLRLVRRMYIPAILGIILGIVMLFGSTIRTLGDGTVFWTHRSHMKYVGVVMIVVGVVLLLTVVGMESHSVDKLKQAGVSDIKPVIHPDFLIEEEARERKQHFKESFTEDNVFDTNSGLERQHLLFKQTHNDGGDDGFFCSSISSAASFSQAEGCDLTARWARAMAVSFGNNEGGQTLPRDEDKVPTNFKRIDSAQLRALNNAPCIEITSVDETLPCRSPSTISLCGSMSENSSNSSLKNSEQDPQSRKYSRDDTIMVVLPLHGISEESIHSNDDRNVIS